MPAGVTDLIIAFNIVGSVFTVIAGTLLHFTYDWCGRKKLAGAFSAVNESTWEHLKLLFTPMFAFSILEFLVYGRTLQNFFAVRFLSILLGMAVIVIAFYTYVGIIGKHFLAADIGTLLLGVIVAYWFSASLLPTSRFTAAGINQLGVFGMLLLLACVVFFTFAPPHIPLFKDPVTGRYGRTA